MKNSIKIFFTALFMLLLSTGAYSQLIVRGGVNLATITGGSFSDKDNLVGLNIALAGDLGLGDQVAVQPELHFVQKGVVAEGGLFNTRTTTVYNYLEVPLLMKIKVSQGYLLVGPAVDLALGGKRTTENRFGSGGSTISADDMSTGNLSLQFGAGVNIDNAIIDVRYGMGFGDDFELNDNEPNTFRGLRLTLGFKL